MKHAIILLVLIVGPVWASLPEFFASSASTMGIGGQCNFEVTDAANAFYCPAILSFEDGNSINANTLTVSQQFKKINNVVTTNPLNDPTSSTTYGNYDLNDEDAHFSALHLSMKFFKSKGSKLSASVFTPVDKFVQADTGDFYAPEYVMYKSRYKRMQFFANLGFRYSDSITFSVGILGGLQSSGQTNIVASDSGASQPSAGSMSFNATPSLAPTMSFAYKWSDQNLSYLSYHSEMKSNIEHFADGFTPIGSSSVKYNWKMNSLLYYDPAVVRMGHQFKLNQHRLLATAEYQNWQNYETPKLHIKNQGGILISSLDYENIEVKNIVIPKLGYQLIKDKYEVQLGLSYRPTPIVKDHSKAGNSLDSNKYILSLAYLKPVELLGQKIKLATAVQGHFLETVRVNKGPNMEDGNSGSKIGSGGHEIGGQVFVLSFGISWVL